MEHQFATTSEQRHISNTTVPELHISMSSSYQRQAGPQIKTIIVTTPQVVFYSWISTVFAVLADVETRSLPTCSGKRYTLIHVFECHDLLPDQQKNQKYES